MTKSERSTYFTIGGRHRSVKLIGLILRVYVPGNGRPTTTLSLRHYISSSSLDTTMKFARTRAGSCTRELPRVTWRHTRST
jgi:hypothetical protein